MKSNKKKNYKQVGIYGGEVSGSNPMNWSLLQTILAQFRHLGWHCVSDTMGDGSCSYIEVFKEDPAKATEGKIYSFSLQFDKEGNVISDLRFFKESVIKKIDQDRTEQIF